MVDVEIIPPSLASLFLNKTAKVVCKVTIHSKAKKLEIIWEDERGNALEKIEKQNGQKSLSLSLDIPYQTWAAGLKRICYVHHSLLLTPVERVYQEARGKKVSLSV